MSTLTYCFNITIRSEKVNTQYFGGDDSYALYGTDYETAYRSMEDAVKQIRRLEAVGIHYFTSFITGITGDNAEAGLQHARKTAEFLNQLHPDYSGSSSLSIFDNTEIGVLVREGKFHTASEIQMLKETREMLAHLNTQTFFFGAHASNMVPVNGRIPEQKEEMLANLDQAISEMETTGYSRRYDRDGRM